MESRLIKKKTEEGNEPKEQFMFHLIPISRQKGNRSLHFPIAFLGQFLVIATVIFLFLLYVTGFRI
jgi:hypothetical protein